MSTKRVPDIRRCPDCGLNKLWCICQLFQEFSNPNTMVSIVMHFRERHLTSNTARLLEKSLSNCEIILRGQKGSRLEDELTFKQGYQPLYLFPHEDAQVLNSDFVSRLDASKFHLIIPDGTWSQCQKFYRRESIFKNIPCVKLENNYQSSYGLRKQHIEGGVCTMEAGALALGVLESKILEEKLLNSFFNIIERMQLSRSPNSHARQFIKRDKDA